MKLFKNSILSVITGLMLTFMPVLPLASTVYADCGTPSSSKTQVQAGIGETGSDCSSDGVTKIIAAAVQILSIVTGVAGVIMVILAGFKYITSGGDSNKVANAKSTLIYALVGLAIAGAAQALVHFAIDTGANVNSK